MAFRERLTSMAILVLVASCSNPSPMQRAKEYAESIPPEDAGRALLDSYKSPARQIFEAIRSNVAAKDRRALTDARLIFTEDETPFSFRADAEWTRAIYVNLGGLNALEMGAIAFALSIVELKDPNWFLNYLIYHRKLKQQPDAEWLEPAIAAGLAIEDQSQKTAYIATSVLNDMMTFVIAHEAGHIVLAHSAKRKDDEPDGDYWQRRQTQEIEADAFSVPVSIRLGINPHAPIATLLVHHIVFEDGHPGESATHPSDLQRIASCAELLRSTGTTEAVQVAEWAEGFVSHMRSPTSFTAYDALDQLAESVSREALKRPKLQ